MSNYIGLDAHSETCTIVVLDSKGKLKSRERVRTTERDLVMAITEIKGEKELVLEELGISQWLYLILKDHVDRIVVCSPSHLPKKLGPKNDFADAFELADLLRCDRLTEVYHDDGKIIRLRSLVSGYGDLNQSIVRVKNQISALYRRQAISLKGNREYLSKSLVESLDDEHKRFVCREHQVRLSLYLSQKEKYSKEFELNKRVFKEIRILMKVPGIGIVSANQILATVVTAERFTSKYQFYGYCKLVNYRDESDGVIYKKRSSHGRPDMKVIFKAAGQTVLRGESAMREYYDFHREQGKSHQTALNATCRKIAATVLAVLRTGKNYSDKKLKQEVSRNRQSLKRSS